MAKFLLHSNQGRKNRSYVYLGNVSHADGAQGKTEELDSISRFHSSDSPLGGRWRKHIPLRILATKLFQIYTLNVELELKILQQTRKLWANVLFDMQRELFYASQSNNKFNYFLYMKREAVKDLTWYQYHDT